MAGGCLWLNGRRAYIAVDPRATAAPPRQVNATTDTSLMEWKGTSESCGALVRRLSGRVQWALRGGGLGSRTLHQAIRWGRTRRWMAPKQLRHLVPAQPQHISIMVARNGDLVLVGQGFDEPGETPQVPAAAPPLAAAQENVPASNGGGGGAKTSGLACC